MKFKNILLMIIIALVFGVGGYLTGSNQNKDKKEEPKEKEVTNCLEAVDEPTKKVENDYINKTFTKTYNINHIAPSNNFDYIYITIRIFQDEEIETVKVRRELFEDAEVGDNYEIKFKVTGNELEDNIKSIFNNCEIVSANKTDKTGLEQINEFVE